MYDDKFFEDLYQDEKPIYFSFRGFFKMVNPKEKKQPKKELSTKRVKTMYEKTEERMQRINHKLNTNSMFSPKPKPPSDKGKTLIQRFFSEENEEDKMHKIKGNTKPKKKKVTELKENNAYFKEYIEKARN